MTDLPTPTDIVRRRIREIRLARGWSLDTLAARILWLENKDDTDTRLVRSKRMIAQRIETGGRGISFDDWFLYAAALGVSPLVLILPDSEQEGEKLKIEERLRLSARLVAAWLGGGGPLRPEDTEIYEANVIRLVPLSRFPVEDPGTTYLPAGQPFYPEEQEAMLGLLSGVRRRKEEVLRGLEDVLQSLAAIPAPDEEIVEEIVETGRPLQARADETRREIANLVDISRLIAEIEPMRDPPPELPRKEQPK
jgi:transcriptional regulator with XRE-family HTH domain